MLVHPQFDPVALHIGPFNIAGTVIAPFAIRWYGLMYLVGFVLFVVLGRKRARQNLLTGWHPRDIDDMLFYGVVGVVLFVILWLYASRHRPMGAVSGLFLLGYGTLRFIAEFAREPDNFLGYLAGDLTMGQWLSLPMILTGFLMMIWSYRRAGKAEPTLLDRLK